LAARSDARFVVTGAGGWLGRAAVEMLDWVFGDTVAERVSVFGAATRALPLRSGRSLRCLALDRIADLAAARPYILHFAFLGGERVAEGHDAYVAANLRIRSLVSQAIARLGTRGLFVPSSGAVYRRPGRDLQRDRGADLYGAMKLEDEEHFRSEGDRLGFPVTVIRVFNLGGPFINKLDGYALATILRDIAGGGPILLRARQEVVRSYAHVGDVLNVALAQLLAGAGSGPFDTAGERAVEIGELARIAANLLGDGPIEIRRPEFDGSAENRYVGDGARFRGLIAAAGREPIPLERQIIETATYLREIIPGG
jgi:nucleoside-diphosphate-sugar epimerase